MEPSEALTHIASVPDRASAEACFGQAVSSGDRTVIPVAEVTYAVGFGWGGGGGIAHSDDGEQDVGGGYGGGGGAGGRARGVAAIEVGPDGVRIHPIHDQTAITLAGLTFATGAMALTSRTLLKLIRG